MTAVELQETLKKVHARRSKYGSVWHTVGGIKFQSKHEAKRWGELQLLERSGKITQLKRQVPFKLDVDGVHIATYKADFTYIEMGSDGYAQKFVCNDAKGFKTDVYKIKKALMKALHHVEILET